jgi:cytochrome c oxidase subunit IV
MAEATAHGHQEMHAGQTAAVLTDTHQEHPIKLYLVVWVWLFILSAASYMVDYFHVQGALRWSLILIFMMLKAGLIVAVFMHMAWERLALVYAILVPPIAVLVFVWIMAVESEYTLWTRLTFFGPSP